MCEAVAVAVVVWAPLTPLILNTIGHKIESFSLFLLLLLLLLLLLHSYAIKIFIFLSLSRSPFRLWTGFLFLGTCKLTLVNGSLFMLFALLLLLQLLFNDIQLFILVSVWKTKTITSPIKTTTTTTTKTTIKKK